MDHIPHKVNLWILITLCSLLGWIIYWVPPAIYRFFSFDGTPWQEAIQNYGLFFMIMELSGAVGMLLRFIGVFLAILVLKEFWPRHIWGRDKNFFDVKNLDALKDFLRENPSKVIYTDHFTKYSVDLIREYESNNSKRILGDDFNFSQINKGQWVLYNKKHIEELKMQKYTFPNFNILNTNEFRKVGSFKDFIFYEKSD